MNRRMAVLSGSILAALAVAEIVVLSGLLAAERRDDRERYRDAMARQRRDAGRSIPVATAPRKSRTPHTFCVHGVDTFATTARKTLDKELLDGQRRLDVGELCTISDLAMQAERYAETASGGPGLPQRMGRVRSSTAQPSVTSTADRQPMTRKEPAPKSKPDRPSPAWQALAPARIDCDDSDAYALFRLDVTMPPAPARPAATPDPAGSKTRGKGKGKTRGKGKPRAQPRIESPRKTAGRL